VQITLFSHNDCAAQSEIMTMRAARLLCELGNGIVAALSRDLAQFIAAAAIEGNRCNLHARLLSFLNT